MWEELRGRTVAQPALGEAPQRLQSLLCPPAVAKHCVPPPCSGLRPWSSETGVARGWQRLTAPCFWQVPASSTTASSCWSARIHPWPGPLPAACPRSSVSHPWPSPASSSWRSPRSGMRVKKPCQVSSPGEQPLPTCCTGLLPGHGPGARSRFQLPPTLPACFSHGSPILTLALYPSVPLQIKTSLRWTSEFPAPRLQAMAGPVPGPRGGAGTVTSWLQPSLMLGMDV